MMSELARWMVWTITITSNAGIENDNDHADFKSQAIVSTYGDFPSLRGARITEIRFKEGEPRLLVKLVTIQKPKSSPRRWPKDYDQVYLNLSFIGTRNLKFEQWAHNNIIDTFDLEDVGESVVVKAKCLSGAELTFLCDWINIESITHGYLGTP
ncbi:immunity 50 family protein [Paraburkholderia caribensis]|uniref:immunity 50 family protein n=1 Tax=Paraburkholderia caribensis TaxID=75105 RepID=UPI0034D229D8